MTASLPQSASHYTVPVKKSTPCDAAFHQSSLTTCVQFRTFCFVLYADATSRRTVDSKTVKADVLAGARVLVLNEEFRGRLKVTEHSLLVCQHSSLVPCLTVLTITNIHISFSSNQSIFICIRQPEPIVTRPIHKKHTQHTEHSAELKIQTRKERN